MTQQQFLSVYQAYVDAWEPNSEAHRKSVLAEVFEPDMTYLVPEYDGGTSETLQDMERFQQQYPGAHFEIENIAWHHQVALFGWVLVLADGKVTVKGHDCVRFSPGGKIASLITFGPASPK